MELKYAMLLRMNALAVFDSSSFTAPTLTIDGRSCLLPREVGFAAVLSAFSGLMPTPNSRHRALGSRFPVAVRRTRVRLSHASLPQPHR